MVFEMLREMIVEILGCDEASVTLSAELRDDLGLSDSQIAEVLEAMASELGFRPEDIDLEEVYTAKELVRNISVLL